MRLVTDEGAEKERSDEMSTSGVSHLIKKVQ